ncbi:MAG: hypothetical protein HYV66_02975 [Candidatus Sungbacteria bacterium]|uniref:TrbC/VirB2 family protein n=2 Tax=Candidatus Sungiibacteriota bacterium TaxID=2750080 RepID=A0A931YDY7_9BACT|nr:hypothetical protein [Candidatus Sungbacteria bacterium]
MLKLFIVFILLLATPVFVGAQDDVGGGGGDDVSGGGDVITITNPLGYDTIPEVLNRIIDFLALLAAPIAVLMLVWAAYLFVLAGTSPDNVKKAKSIILYVVVGLMVLGLSKAIVSVTLSVLNTPAPPP